MGREVVFVLDRSASMRGEAFEQARRAASDEACARVASDASLPEAAWARGETGPADADLWALLA